MAKYGYDKLADFMGRYPEYAIYRKFGALSAKKLLYQQAEISKLDRDLQILCELDQEDDATKDFATSWITLQNVSEEAGANLQAEKAREAFEKLEEYHRSIIQTVQILALANPRKSELAFLRVWLDSADGGDSFLQGRERMPYSEETTPDLLTLSPTAGRDVFAQFLSDKIVPWYHRCLGHRKKIVADKALGSLWEYKHRVFEVMADSICSILSSLIPVTSIFLLYYAQSMSMKLGIATIMNFLLSFITAVVVRGRRVDVFAASTAFAAIQVVFIGGVSILSVGTERSCGINR